MFRLFMVMIIMVHGEDHHGSWRGSSWFMARIIIEYVCCTRLAEG
jgi:hypothetical protein